MNNCIAPASQTRRRFLPIAWAAVLAAASTGWLALPAHARGRHVTPPPVPAGIQVEAGNEAFLEGHAVGTQNYICLPAGSGVAWSLFTPQATLFDDHGKQITTHFFSPNPENGTVRATWQHSRDTSTVWAALERDPSSDPNFVAPGAIPWLLLRVVGAQDGPFWGDTLTETTFIHRVNTRGGSAPSTGCIASADVGKKAFVPYTADYFFYTDHRDR